MTITQLEYIIAVDNHRHFGKAAKSCFVTQPTLSMQVSKLEDQLGVLLFDRNKKPVEPTPLGRQIIDQAKSVIAESQHLERIAQSAKTTFSGTFRLGVIPTIAPSLVPRFIDAFVKTYPDIELIIEEGQTNTLIQKLRLEELDVALLATPLEEKNIIELPLYYEPFMAFIPEGHELHKEKFLTTTEINVQQLLLLNEGHCFRNSVINMCGGSSEVDSNTPFKLESGNFETLIRLSERGYGMTLLPYLTTLDLGEERKENIKPLAQPKPTREISLVYSKNQVKTGLINELADIIKKNIPEKLLEKDLVVSPLKNF